MREVILNFNKQFEYEPEIQNKNNFKVHNKFIVSGMGGSHLAADLIKCWKPNLDIIVHKDYGLPQIPESELTSRLFIANSYSGNTEEIIDGLKKALSKKLSILVISIGGELIELARSNSLPYIQMPDLKLQPRNATGLSFRALLKGFGEENTLIDSKKLSASLKPYESEETGRKIAASLKGSIPVIYSSAKNQAIAYNWKIKLNETGKIPAFYNVFPELNHNEMTGFDLNNQNRNLIEKFHFIFLEDQSDHPKIQKRMTVLKELYEARGLKVESISFENIFSILILGDWVAYYTALEYGLDPEPVPMVEEFKRLIAKP